MPRLTAKIPKYSLHKGSGQAVVRLSGRMYYLGPHGSKASRREYDRLIGEWTSNGRYLKPVASVDMTVSEAADAYVGRARSKYGQGDFSKVKAALGSVCKLYGGKPAREFGPVALKAVRLAWAKEGHRRGYVLQLAGHVTRWFKWLVSEELIPEPVYAALLTVERLPRGAAAPSEKVKSAREEIILAAIEHMRPTIADMVWVQLLTGMRAGELVQLRPKDIDRTKDVWVFTPEHHKTEDLGERRPVFIGPRAQAVLAKYMLRDPDSYCFCPHEAYKSYCEAAGVKYRLRATRRPGARYRVDSYGHAVLAACDRAFPAPGHLRRKPREKKAAFKQRIGPQGLAELSAWRKAHRFHTHQLRHSAGTEVRKKFDLETAQGFLGHASIKTTEVYAEPKFEAAAEAARQVG